MKQVIKGVTYNTETATLIEQWNNVGKDDILSIRDINFESVALYRRKDGKYFFWNEGVDCPAWGIITPVSIDRARSFCEGMEWTAERLAKEFGESPQTEISARISTEKYNALLAYAHKNGLNEREVLEKAIDTFLVSI